MTKKLLLFILASFLYLSQSISQNVYFDEDFSLGIKGWITVDEDGDGYEWGIMRIEGIDGYCAASPSIDEETGDDLNTENWLISPVIDLTEASEKITLTYYIGADDEQYFRETYKIYIKTEEENAPDTAYIEDFTRVIQYETLQEFTEGYLDFRTLNISGWSGQKIRLAFVHTESSGQSFLLLKNVKIEDVTDNADLSVENILSPASSGYYYMNTDISVSFSLVNKAFIKATNVKATYKAPDGIEVTEDLPDIESGQLLSYTFDKPLPGYDRIVEGEPITITVSAANDGNLTNNTLTSTFTVLPLSKENVVMNWDFEDPYTRSNFEKDFTLRALDNSTIADIQLSELYNLRDYFPNNVPWRIVQGNVNDEDYPEDYWGEYFIASTSYLTDGVQADRWVITPKFTLTGSYAVLTWIAGIGSFGGMSTFEAYEILISETGTDPEDFTRIGAILEFGNILAPYSYRINISEYAGKDIHIAFRNVNKPLASMAPSLLMIDNIRVWSDEGGYWDSISEEKEENGLSIYPNPVKDVLHLEGKEIVSVELINTSGQIEHKEFLAGTSSYTLNIGHLPSSIYIVKIYTKDGNTIIKKVIKQ